MTLPEAQKLIYQYLKFEESHFFISDYIDAYFEKVDPDEYKGIFSKYGLNLDDDVEEGHNLISLFGNKERDRILTKIKDQLPHKDCELLVKQELDKANGDNQDYYLTRLSFIIDFTCYIDFPQFPLHISPIVDWLTTEYIQESGKLEDYRVLVVFEQIINTIKNKDRSTETTEMIAKICSIAPRGDEWIGVIDHLYRGLPYLNKNNEKHYAILKYWSESDIERVSGQAKFLLD